MTSFSINVNGELCGNFKGKRGLREEDLLSLPLFVITMEVFSSMLTKSFDEGCIGYHPLGRNPKVSHLAFTDDVVSMFDGTTSLLQV